MYVVIRLIDNREGVTDAILLKRNIYGILEDTKILINMKHFVFLLHHPLFSLWSLHNYYWFSHATYFVPFPFRWCCSFSSPRVPFPFPFLFPSPLVPAAGEVVAPLPFAWPLISFELSLILYTMSFDFVSPGQLKHCTVLPLNTTSTTAYLARWFVIKLLNNNI